MLARAERKRPRALILGLILAAAPAARAEVGADARRVEDSADTLHRGEWKLGLTTSSYGVTDWLQIDSALLLDLATLANGGVKARIYKDAVAALAVEVDGGYFALAPVLFGGSLWSVGGRGSLTLTFGPRLLGHLMLGARTLAGNLTVATRRYDAQLTWLDLRGVLEWDVTRNHVLLLTVGTPTSWIASLGSTAESFDALDFWAALVGYQVSLKHFNVRVDAGYGPGVLGRGLAVDVDMYFRF